MTRHTSFSYFSLFFIDMCSGDAEVPSSVLCYKSFKCIISLIINIEHALLEYDHFDSVFSICINRTTLHPKFQKSQQRLQLNKNQNTHTQGLACCQLHATSEGRIYSRVTPPCIYVTQISKCKKTAICFPDQDLVDCKNHHTLEKNVFKTEA